MARKDSTTSAVRFLRSYMLCHRLGESVEILATRLGFKSLAPVKARIARYRKVLRSEGVELPRLRRADYGRSKLDASALASVVRGPRSSVLILAARKEHK